MAMAYGDATYGNALRKMVTDPNSFQGTPGFQFALNTGLDSTARGSAASGLRGSGNALAALQQYGTGLAMQDYGNQFSRLAQAAGQEQGYDLGQGKLALGQQQLGLDQQRLGLDTELGRGQLALGQGRLGLDRDLGMGRLGLDRDLGMGRLNLDTELGRGQLANTAQRNQFDYNIGLGNIANNATRNEYDYNLGLGQNANNAQRNQFDYNLGLGQNANTAAANQNQFNLGMFNAQTNRGNALADFYFRNRGSRPNSFNTPGGLVTTNPRF